MAAAARRRDDQEWTPAEIGRALSRIEKELDELAGRFDTTGAVFVHRNEWNQRLVGTDQRLGRVEADVSSIENRLLGTGARAVQVITPIIAGLALVVAIFRGA